MLRAYSPSGHSMVKNNCLEVGGWARAGRGILPCDVPAHRGVVLVRCAPPSALSTQTTPKTLPWLGAACLSPSPLLWLFTLGVPHLGFARYPCGVIEVGFLQVQNLQTLPNVIWLGHWCHLFCREVK